MDELLKWRDEFPILGRTTYMISNSLGAMPRGVYDKVREYAESWATRGVRAWEESWWDLAATVGDKVAALIGAPPGSVSLHQNVTTTQAVITSCFDFSGPRNKVVLVDLEFPSILYFYQEQQARGARIEIVRNADGIHIPPEKLLAAIDERTLLVPISMVLFRSATILDARAIIERAHHVGAHVVLDVFQATGTVPVDVTALQTDFAVGGVLKWLCGGPGVAYLYVRPDLCPKLAPRFTGWFAHKRPFDIIREVGVARIREKSIRQTARLIAGAKARGWRVNTPADPAERGGTVSVECPHAAEVMRELLARDVLVDYRPKAGIRLSPHFYNRDEEIDFAMEQIADILATRAWERHAVAAAH